MYNLGSFLHFSYSDMMDMYLDDFLFFNKQVVDSSKK